MSLAPVVLFVYNRLDHTQQVVDALRGNELAEDTDLHIYADAAKDVEALEKVQALREYLPTITGFRKVSIQFRAKNMGVDANVISGVTEIIERYGKAIVLEDDLITSPYFLRYMNEALDHYEQKDKVISIHGYVYPVVQQLNEVFFLKGADCWGWATWKRGWDLFEPDGKKLLDQLEERKLEKEFDFENTYPYLQALREQANGETTCWDIRWYAAAFLADKLTLYPGKSLIRNIGLDGTGTHCGDSNSHDVELSPKSLNVKAEPEADPVAYEAFADFFRDLAATPVASKKNIFSRAFKKMRATIKATLN